MSRIQSSGGGGGTGITSANYKVGISPNESPDGARTLFTLPEGYTAGTLAVYRNGERLQSGVTETSPASGTFTLSVAPDADEPLKADYIKA